MSAHPPAQRRKYPFFWSVLLLGCASTPAFGQAAPAARFGGAPDPAGSAVERVFEMRTYTAHEGKLEDLQRRFRDHTTRLFEKHGMTNIGYWVPQDGDLARTTLIYVLAYPSREAATAAWTAFRADPEWQAARAASEEAGPLVQRVESVFMSATDFSAIR